MSAARYLVTPDEIGAELVTKLVGDIKLPQRQINGSSYKAHYISAGVEWRAIRDNLRNFFLSSAPEMLNFFQRLQEAL